MEQRDFFISFTSADRPWAEWINFQLQTKGYTTWYQYDDFPAGTDFMQQMNLAMANSRLTLAIWTRNYFNSHFANLEARTAFKRSLEDSAIRFVPVKVEECDIDPLFSTLVYINLAGKKDDFEASKLLIAGIRASLSLGRPGVKKGKPPFPGKDYAHPENNLVAKEGFNIPQPLRVLYAGSEQSSDLDLEDSYQTIAKGLARHIKKGNLIFEKQLKINTSNIFDVLLAKEPHIFHFSGKQDEGYIRITDEDNNIVTISDVELAGYLSSFGNSLKLAVIDTCYSYNCARSISNVVDFAIGVKDSIYDVDADRYYKTFYNALCSAYSVKDAVAQATASLRFKSVPVKEIPVLFSKKTADPSKAFFVRKQ